MAKRVTDLTVRTATPPNDTLLEITIPSDTSQNPAGSSFSQAIGNFLKGKAFTRIGAFTLLIKGDGKEDTSLIEDTDIIIYQNVSLDRFAIATAKADALVLPADLDDSSKVAKWIDTGAAL